MTTEQPQLTGHAHRRDSISEVLGRYQRFFLPFLFPSVRYLFKYNILSQKRFHIVSFHIKSS